MTTAEFIEKYGDMPDESIDRALSALRAFMVDWVTKIPRRTIRVYGPDLTDLEIDFAHDLAHHPDFKRDFAKLLEKELA